MNHNPFIEREERFGAKNYEPLPIVLSHGQGVYVWDEAGKKYLDMMGAYSAVSHGHCHPKLIDALIEQARRLSIVSRAFYTDKLGFFLEAVCQISGFEKALPMNTGAEAVETALKAARKWGYTVKGIPEDKAEIIACRGNFHGRTISIISMSTENQYREGFGPLTPGFHIVPYGDINALEKAITPNTAAFLVEPIQGEGGIILPPSGYLKACEMLCKQHNVLMICDEIQTGLGRTGKMFAFEHEGITPDGIVLGKALGGGLLPISVFLTKAAVMDVFTPGDHGSTFGGNPLAAVVGLAALNVLIEEDFVGKAAEAGHYFQTELKKIKSPLIKDVRGKGLLIGVEINAPYSAHEICVHLLSQGILTRETHHTVIRFAPPLIIEKSQIDATVAALDKTLSSMQKEFLPT